MSALSHLRAAANVIGRKPLAVIFEATLRCNSACGYCALPLNQGRRELTRAEIARIFRKLYDQGVRYVFVQGGEPLVRADILDVLEDLCAIGFIAALVTNGTRVTAAVAARLRGLRIHLSISLDTLDRERYRCIRGRDQLPSVLRAVELLQDHPHPRFIVCILTDVNRKDVEGVVRFARDKGFVPIVGAYHWSIGAYGKVRQELQYDAGDAIAALTAIRDARLVPDGYAREYLRDTIDWLAGNALERCDAGRYSVAIDASGNVAACLAHPHAGNLLSDELPAILARMDRKKIDACSAASTCNLACSRFIGKALRHPVMALRTLPSLRDRKAAL